MAATTTKTNAKKNITGARLKFKFSGTPEDLQSAIDKLNEYYSAKQDGEPISQQPPQPVTVEATIVVTVVRGKLDEILEDVLINDGVELHTIDFGGVFEHVDSEIERVETDKVEFITEAV